MFYISYWTSWAPAKDPIYPTDSGSWEEWDFVDLESDIEMRKDDIDKVPLFFSEEEAELAINQLYTDDDGYIDEEDHFSVEEIILEE